MQPRELYNQALQAHKDQQIGVATAKLKELLSQDPTFFDAYEALAVILYNEKEYHEAITLIKQWLEKQPDAIMAYTNLSRCYVALGKIEEAEEAQGQSSYLAMRGKFDQPSSVNEAKEEYEKKVAKYEKIINYDPADPLGYFSLGQVHYEHQQFSKALKAYLSAIEQDPTHAASYYQAGLCYEKMSQESAAEEILKRGLKVAAKQGEQLIVNKIQSRL